MTISEMHEVFRVLSQQMGLHLTRSILPESIDIFLNMEINAVVREKLLQTSTLETQNNSNLESISVAPLNLFKNLYTKCNKDLTSNDNIGDIYSININDLFNVQPMMYLGFSIVNNSNETIKCRMVEPMLIDTFLNDYCNKPDINNPIVTICNNENADCNIKLYVNNKVKSLIIDYIKYPNTVSLKHGIDCDLPDYIHYDIVNGAVKRFDIATNKISDVQKR